MTKECNQLTQIIAKIIDLRRDLAVISPSKVATEAMQKLGADWMQGGDYPLVYLGCHLQLRQIARGLLRQQFEPEEDEEKITHPLFPELQWRYPIAHPKGEEPQYRLLELLSPNDWEFNVNRLRSDARSRLNHADKLVAWGHAHFTEAVS
jgi:hypothetical protein